MTDQHEKRRHDLLQVLLIALEFKRVNSPWPHVYDGSENRYRDSFARSTEKKFFRGLEQAARETVHSVEEWPRDQREIYFQKVRDATGLSFFEIVGDIEKDVEKLLRKKKIRTENDLRLLIDYVSDYPNGQYFEAARELLNAQGIP